ncbi:MAG: S8 family serine peptidase [Deltaproteobacteria bacterium]|nr:S8 family serine peptidase [Deltaproteobacteria bacterium]
MQRPRHAAVLVPLVAMLAIPASAHAGPPHEHPAGDGVAEGGVAEGGAELRELPWQHSGVDVEALAAVATDGLLIDFDDDLSDEAIEAIERETGLDLEDTTKFADGNLWVLRGTPADIERAVHALKARRDIEGVEPNAVYSLFDQDLEAPVDGEPTKPAPTAPNDPMYKSQWHMKMVNAEDAWSRTRGEGVIVAVLDTGVSPGKLHGGKDSRFKRVPDLKDTEFVDGWNFVNDNADPSDGHAHGTHVAGTIAQTTNNAYGVVGLAHKAKIMPVKVLSDGGSGSVASIANGIRWAADHKAKVINMSLGGGMYSSTLAKAVKYAHDKGVTVVCAAGNGGRQKVEYPAAYDGAVAISALGPDGKLAFYSSYGKELDLAAPGGDTRVDLNKDGIPDGVLQDTIAVGDPTSHGFFPFQGTSMATPHAAAAAALVIATGVTDPDRVEKILESTARDLKDPIRYGAGALDAGAATKKGTRDHAVGGLGLAAVLAGLAVVRARKKDGLFTAARMSPGLAGALVLGSGAWMGFVPGLGIQAGVVTLLAGGAVVGMLALGFGIKALRLPLAGLAFGVAGFLLCRAALGSVDVALVPGHGWLDLAWLTVNGAVAALVGRIALAR